MQRIAAATFVLLLPAQGNTQCSSKPAIPDAGLAVTSVLDQPLTYADGYRTRVNFYHPSTARPTCGWPLVVHVHGWGGKRKDQSAIAARGFAVVTYDVRGQGDTKALNPGRGLTVYGATEKYDLAEVVEYARAKWRTIVSPSRLAVTGGSQGGIHSWFAAAYAGRSITIAGRGTIKMPRPDVVAPTAFGPDILDHAVRDRTLFASDGFERFWRDAGAVIDPAFRATYKQRFLAQDPTGLAAQLAAEKDRAITPLVPSITVPVFWHMAYLDGVQQPREGLRAALRIPKATPFQALLSTNGHGSPINTVEVAYWSEQRIRWFDRYLWNVRNGVGTERRWVVGVLPQKTSELRSWTHEWDHRHDAAWPAADLTAARLYLTSAGRLQSAPPAPGAATVIRHTVRPSYTANRYASSVLFRSLGAVLNNIPLSERTFQLPPLAAERELGGTPRVSLRVVPSAERFTVCALLSARIPGQGAQMICSWARGVLGARVGVPQTLAFDLPPAVATLPKGTVLTLTLRNHWLREAPMARRLVTVPYFTSATVDVRHGSGIEASWLELPWRRDVRAGLVISRQTMQVRRPGNIAFELRGGDARAGRAYLTLVSLSGHAPGIPLPGGVLPLKPDALTDLFLGLLGGAWPSRFLGTLDATGRATPSISFTGLRLPPELAGGRMSFASWILDGSGIAGSPTNPADLILR